MGGGANSVEPDQTPQSASSDVGLYYLLKPVYLITYYWY